jgi:hypothetical protein
LSILPQSQCGRESSTLVIERIVILLLAAAMMVIVFSQDSREKMRLKADDSPENHQSCELSKSFNCWLDASFGGGEAEFDAHKWVFRFNRDTHQSSPGLSKVKSSLSGPLTPEFRLMERPSSIFFDLLAPLNCRQNRPGDRICRTLALLTLGSCVLLYGWRQMRPRRASPLQERLAKQRLNWQSLQFAAVLFGGGCLVLTILQLRFSQHDCSQARGFGFRTGTLSYGSQVLSTCTFDGSSWGLPRLITIFGVEQDQADQINLGTIYWRDPNVRVIAQPKPRPAQAVSGLWTNLTHPSASSVDALTLCYGFFCPLGILIWRRRKLMAVRPTAKSLVSTTDDFQQVLDSVLQAPPALSMPKARFAEMLEIHLAPGLMSISGLPDFELERSRLHLSAELGIQCPRVNFRPNQGLANAGYSIRVREVEVASGQLFANKWLAIGSQYYLEQLTGPSAENPILGLPGRWVDGEEVGYARSLGCLVLSPSQILMTHLELMIRAHAWQLLTHQEAYNLLKDLSETHPRLVSDVSRRFEVSPVKQVLQRLLREQVSLRDLPLILETMLDSNVEPTDVRGLSEAARKSLAHGICRNLLDANGSLSAITLDPSREAAIKDQTPSVIGDFLESLKTVLDDWSEATPPIVLVSSEMRLSVREIVSHGHPDLPVIAWDEIPSGVQVEGVAMLSC